MDKYIRRTVFVWRGIMTDLFEGKNLLTDSIVYGDLARKLNYILIHLINK